VSNEQHVREILERKLFSGSMPPEFIDFCLAHGRFRHYAPKQYLYFSDDEGNTVYFLVSGRIRLYLRVSFPKRLFAYLIPQLFSPK